MAGNKTEINLALKSLKTENGLINFRAVLSGGERLPKMFEDNPEQTTALVVAGLTLVFESMNLNRPMTATQILDLADTIIDSSDEDYLRLEDVMLFLQGLVRGKYGALYESMDIPKFMEKFEMYRQERHEAYEGIKYEKHVSLTAMGDTTRISEDQDREKELTKSAISDYLREKYKDGSDKNNK